MKLILPSLYLITVICFCISCSPAENPGKESSSTIEQEQISAAGEQDTVEAETPFNLMDYSALDTSSGIFEGEYEEEVNEEITVRVALRVKLEQGKITAIELLDTTWVHPSAAKLIPQRIIESQRLPVEAVTGASVASWSIMTATALALEIDLTELDDFAALEE